jgi:hypothetical protein
MGKTNMDEFAMGSSTEHSAYGPTANPWNLGRVPGGSSGGSAAAVAAYHAPVCIGTDTGGSIRQPGSMCGVVGIKPTYGRVSRYGIVAFASSLDQIGPFARDARDAAALLHAVSGRDERDATSAPVPVPAELLDLPAGDDEAAAYLKGRRIALPKEYFVAGMEPGVAARVREAVGAMEQAGAIVEEVSLPHTEYGLAAYYIIAPAEASSNLARFDGVGTAERPHFGRVHRGLPADTRRRFRARGQAPHHARHVRSVGRLLRRLLPQGPEGPDAHQVGLRRRLGGRLRRHLRPDEPYHSFPAGRQIAGSRGDVSRRRLHSAAEHGGPARNVHPGRSRPTASPSASRSLERRGASCRCYVWPARMKGSRPEHPGGRWSPPNSS